MMATRTTYRTGLVQFALVNVLYEGDVVVRVPVERVEHVVERATLEHFVDWLEHVLAVLQSRVDY